MEASFLEVIALSETNKAAAAVLAKKLIVPREAGLVSLTLPWHYLPKLMRGTAYNPLPANVEFCFDNSDAFFIEHGGMELLADILNYELPPASLKKMGGQKDRKIADDDFGFMQDKWLLLNQPDQGLVSVMLARAPEYIIREHTGRVPIKPHGIVIEVSEHVERRVVNDAVLIYVEAGARRLPGARMVCGSVKISEPVLLFAQEFYKGAPIRARADEAIMIARTQQVVYL